MSKETLQVPVIGTGIAESLTVELERSLFEELASNRLAKFTTQPAPFVAPCSDGLLLIYNVIRDGIGISGEAAQFRQADLEEHPVLKEAWEKANKPLTIQGALLYFGFPEKRS